MHVERQTVAVRQPFDERSRTVRDRADNRGIGLTMRLALNVDGKQLRIVADAFDALEPRAGGGNEAGRQRRRAGRHGVALDQHRIGAGFLGRQRRAQPGGAGADDQQRRFGVERDVSGRS